MNDIDIQYSPETTSSPIQFGDFTEQELTTIMMVQADTKATTKCKIAPAPHPHSTTSEQINASWFIFGSFTEKECIEIQNFKNDSLSSVFTTNLSYHPRRRCFRCGYNSHTIENCVARRHRSGEYIGYPGFPSHNSQFSQHYPSSPSCAFSEPLKYLRQGGFILDISELRDWMLHDYEYGLNTYLESLQVSVNVSPEQRFQDQVEDQKIGEYLYLDYLTTNLLFEKQATNYFQNLYKTRPR